MSRGRGGRGDFPGFGDPFAGFGGFGGHGSLIPSLFGPGGRDPFDDPFFSRPFGGMSGPSMFGPSMFGSGGNPFGDMQAMLGSGGSPFGDMQAMLGSGRSPFGDMQAMLGSGGIPFRDMQTAGFLENEAPPLKKSRGPIIEEINSDDEVEEDKGCNKEKTEGSNDEQNNPREHSRTSKEPYVQDPDDEAEERKSRHLQYQNRFNMVDRMQPQTRSFSFQSSTVTYGGNDGAYYTSSTAKRTGSDGLTVEESKEADTTTGQAKHMLSRGIYDKGHSVTRKLNSDGMVDTMQTLHNLDEDEVTGFEEAWKGNARKHLPGWNEGFDTIGNIAGTTSSSSGQNGQAGRGGWALPSTEHPVGTSSSSGQNGEAGRGGWAVPSTEQQRPRNPERIVVGNNRTRSNASRGRGRATYRQI